MSNKLSKDEFQQLQSKWYKKLKDNGFVDIESPEMEKKRRDLFQVHETFSGVSDAVAAKQRYYIMAEHFLNTHKFESKEEKLIWKLYSEGVGYLGTLEELKKRGMKSYRTKIHLTIQRLTRIMRSDSNDSEE